MAIVNLFVFHTNAENVFKIKYFNVLTKLSNYARWHFKVGRIVLVLIKQGAM